MYNDLMSCLVLSQMFSVLLLWVITILVIIASNNFFFLIFFKIYFRIFSQRLLRFTKSFDVSNAVDHIEIGGNIFILLNSMAMEGDYCMLCSEATLEIKRLSKILKCTQNFVQGKCYERLNVNYTRPIIMQHFPLFRFFIVYINK